MFFLSNGGLRPHSGHYHPPQTGPPKSRPFNEIEEVTVLKEHFELAYAVPAELFVLEVDGIPSSFLAVEDIDRPRVLVSGHEQEQQDRRRQLDPTNDLDVFGNPYQCGYRCLQIDAGVELHNGFNHHLSKHCSDPFRAVRPCCVSLKVKTPPMAHTSADARGSKCVKGLVLLEVLELEME